MNVFSDVSNSLSSSSCVSCFNDFNEKVNEIAEHVNEVFSSVNLYGKTVFIGTAEVIQNGINEISPDWSKRTRFLAPNFLSQFWTWEAVEEDPTRIIQLASLYMLGAISYAFFLPYRVACLAKEIFHFIFYLFSPLFCCGRKNYFDYLEIRALCLLGETGHVVAGAVGAICPPLAYWMDEKIQSYQKIYDNTWFSARTNPNFFTVAESLNANSGNIQEQLGFLRQQLPIAVTKMSQYINKDDLLAALTLSEITLVGLILNWQSQLHTNQKLSFFNSIQSCKELYRKKIDRKAITKSEELWNQLIEEHDAKTLFEAFTLLAIQRTKESDPTIGENDYVEGQYIVLQGQLSNNPILKNINVLELFDILAKFSTSLLTDSDIATQVTKWANAEDDAIEDIILE